MLPIELILKILENLPDKDKINFLTTNKYYYNNLQKYLLLTDKYDYKKIVNTDFYKKYKNNITYLENVCEIIDFPKNLHTLVFGYSFNQKIEQNVLPRNLREIEFGYKFDQKIELNMLTENIEILKISEKYTFLQDIKIFLKCNNINIKVYSYIFFNKIEKDIILKIIFKCF